MILQRAILFCLCALLLAGCNRSTDLDKKIEAVDAQLEKLPTSQPNMLCPTIGFGSEIVQDPNHTTWLDIVLNETSQLDTIVLIPALLKNKEGGLETLGFPQRFTIETSRDETPGTQYARTGPGGWFHQQIGIYDPAKCPDELVCDLELIQSIGTGESAAAAISVSLYYTDQHTAKFEPDGGSDLSTATEATQVGQSHKYPSWTELSAATGKQSPAPISARFDLSDIPAGASLFLRIANESDNGYAAIDNIRLSPPFKLGNGDFESPSISDTERLPRIQDWTGLAGLFGSNSAGETYSTGLTVVDYSDQDFPDPGTAPVVFRLPPGTLAKKVRITATLLPPEISWREGSRGHNFALNEVLLFDGLKNVALNSRTACADHANYPLMFSPSYAVDGYCYFPPVDPKKVSSPDHEVIDEIEVASQLEFDLGQTREFDEIRLYPVDRSPQFSHLYAMGVGFPRKIKLRVSDQPDLSTARTVLNITHRHQIGVHPLILSLPPTSGRYVWIDMNDGRQDRRTGDEALGVSEIKLLHKGANLLHGIHPLLPEGMKRDFSYLTNGLTSSGIIWPQKEWLLQLQRRAILEQEKDVLLRQQQQWRIKQRRLTQYLKGSLIAALFAALIITWIIRNRHKHNLQQLREKIGANLHDEVGANLSSIALSSEMLTHTEQLTTPQARQINNDITRVAQETATEIRLLSRFLEKQGIESNLLSQLRRVERQMLPGMQTRTDFGAMDQLNALSPTEKWELVLFFKEALHNIVKHAQATRVDIRTHAEGKALVFEITDNGQGLQKNSPPPVHLASRAKKLKAQISMAAPENGGTTIRLTFPKKRRYSP